MTPREIRFGLDGFTAIVIASVAAALASFTWTLAGYASGTSPLGAAVGSYVPPAPAPDVSALINLPPFGKAMLAPATVAADANLVLNGILLANPATASTVLIAVGGKPPIAYRIGEALPDGAVVDMVAVDYVILRRGDQYATLYFPGDQRAQKPGAPAQASPTSPRPVQAAPPSTPGGNGVEAIRSLLPPSVLGRPVAPPQAARPASPPPPPPPPNAASGNGLIDTPGPTVTPRQ